MLLLFDIDGTLVSGATDVHRQALHDALRDVHGIDPRRVATKLAPAGRTDGEIARAILLGAGVSAERIDARSAAVREACCRIYARLSTNDLAHTVLPGIADLLQWLSEREGVRLGLVTGNYEEVARVKLARAGIGRFFPAGEGAFGSDSEDRAALPAIARRRAGRNSGPYPRRQTVVVGDTPRDVACARADGVGCVAVATGPFTVGELRDADAVAADVVALRAVLERLLEP